MYKDLRGFLHGENMIVKKCLCYVEKILYFCDKIIIVNGI